MVVDCIQYRFKWPRSFDSNQDSSEPIEPDCNGPYEQCAKPVTCQAEPGQMMNCFTVWHQANNNSAPTVISAGCHQQNLPQNCSLGCEGVFRGPNLYCCCVSDLCNRKEFLKFPSIPEPKYNSTELTPIADTQPVTLSVLIPVIIVFSIILVLIYCLYKYKQEEKFKGTHCNGRSDQNGRNLTNNLNDRELNELRNRHDVSVLIPFQNINSTSDHYFNIHNVDPQTRISQTNHRDTSGSYLNGQLQTNNRIDLSNIKLLEVVGSGRFGTVHKAETPDCCEIAVKIIQASDHQSWLNELQIYSLPGIKHKHVLNFLGTSEHAETGNYWLVVEYASKGSLYSYLKENFVNWYETLLIAAGISHGLSHLHDTDIAHRDFKSKNVLLKSDLTPCITDFGVAVSLDASHNSQADQKKKYLQVGTPRYMAPEVLECSVTFTKTSFTKIDVYALSLVLWELMSRCHPLPNAAKADSSYAALNSYHDYDHHHHHHQSTHLPSNNNPNHGDNHPPPATQEPPPPATTVPGPRLSPYRVPFEDVAGPNPDISQMRQVVVVEKHRPILKPEWRVYPTSELCRAIEDGWEYDHDARISASCFVERVEGLLHLSNSEIKYKQ